MRFGARCLHWLTSFRPPVDLRAKRLLQSLSMLLLARITSTDPAPFMGKRWYRVLRQLVKGDSTMKSMIHHEDADRLTRHAARPVAARQPLIDSARALLAEGREPESSSCCIGPAAM